jgi:hypothetical protein
MAESFGVPSSIPLKGEGSVHLPALRGIFEKPSVWTNVAKTQVEWKFEVIHVGRRWCYTHMLRGQPGLHTLARERERTREKRPMEAEVGAGGTHHSSRRGPPIHHG